MANTEPAALNIDDGIFRGWVIWAARPSGMRAKVALGAAIVICWIIMSAAANLFGVPALPGFDGSLLHQPSPAAALALVIIFVPICMVIGTFIAGAVRFDAGLVSATLALTAVSVRAGTMRSVLQDASGQSHVFALLFGELLILSALLLICWAALWFLGNMTVVKGPDYIDREDQPIGISALLIQIVSTAVWMAFFCQSESKYQAIGSVGLASWIGAMIAYTICPCRPSIWFWTGPLVVGLLGYLLAIFLQTPDFLAIGHPGGSLGALARPLPIDYASAGPAGAILGYWMMRKSVKSEE